MSFSEATEIYQPRVNFAYVLNKKCAKLSKLNYNIKICIIKYKNNWNEHA